VTRTAAISSRQSGERFFIARNAPDSTPAFHTLIAKLLQHFVERDKGSGADEFFGYAHVLFIFCERLGDSPVSCHNSIMPEFSVSLHLPHDRAVHHRRYRPAAECVSV
jgi:hypothetical protein